MAYSVSRTEDDFEPDDWVPIGVPASYEEAHLISQLLFEQHIDSSWGHGETTTDEVRRVLEDWPAGGQIYVPEAAAHQARQIVGSKLVAPHDWPSLDAYLESRPPGDLIKILDLRRLWHPEVVATTEEELSKRKLEYPPDGKTSTFLPWVCFVLPLWLGPFAALLRLRIDKANHLGGGIERPYYTNATRQKAELYMGRGFKSWVLMMVLAAILGMFIK